MKNKNKQYQIRCPICNGRLFDIIMEEKLIFDQPPVGILVIKCWKCRQKINIDTVNLVRTPHMQRDGVGV